MSESGREAIMWSGGLPRCMGVVGRPSQTPVSGREALQDDREWSGGPPGCPDVVVRPAQVVRRSSRMSCCGREVLTDDRE